MKKNYLSKIKFSTFRSMYLSVKIYYAIIVSLIFVTFSQGQTTAPFTTSGTWTCPAGVTSIQVEAYGAGGGGGYGGTTTNRQGGGGGGGGGYSKNTSITVIPGTTYIITIGSAGAGGSTSTGATANGGNGGNTTATFGTTTITANGGIGGKGYINGSTGGTGGTGTIFNGGAGGLGDGTGSGGGGGCGGTTSNGGNGGSRPTSSAAGTAGGGTIAGPGGAGTINSSAVGGTPASNYGGGGGGGTRNFAGGAGRGGYMLLSYICTPTGNLDCNTSNDYIANVTVNTLNNNTTCTAGGYTNFPASGTTTTSLTRGNTYNLSIRTGPGNRRHGLAVWIDFNQNLSFDDAGEYFFIGNGINANTTNTIAVTIPAGALLGNTRMRVRYGRQTDVLLTSSCTMVGARGETEDYTLTIINPIVCVAPTAQPTNLILTPNSTLITGNFTAANPVPNNYLVVISTSSTPPSPGPNNTTPYAIGATVTSGYTVVDNDANTTFVTSTVLLASTTYYFYIYSFNSACSGGPRYNLISPLSGPMTTLSLPYCIPSVSNGNESDTYFSQVSFVGTLNDFTNYSTFSSSPRGYQDFTGLTNIASQAQGEGVNVSITTPNNSFVKAWVDWNRDGDFIDPGESVYSTGNTSVLSTTFGFIIPSTNPIGNYRIRLRLNKNTGNNTFNSCGNIANFGETEDYLFTVVSSCSALIETATDGKNCGPGSVVLRASTASAGVTQYRWYTTPTGSTLVGTSSTGTWTTPSITTTTTFYVTVFNGCESLVRTPVVAIINPFPNLTYSPTNPTFCGEDAILDLSVTGDKEEVYLINEKFNSGTGTFINTNILTSASDALTQWQNKTSTFIPAQAVWFPAISSGINNTFAYTTSDISATTVHNQLASATVNTSNFTNLTLNLNMYYSHYPPDGVSGANDYVTIDVSTDGGVTWPASGEIKRYIEDVGIGTRFETQTFDLSAYINQSNLKIRVRYYAVWSDGVAVDDIKLYGDRPITTALSWTSSTTIDAYTNIACTPAYAYIPGTPALNIYVKPSLAQLELSSYSFTANAILANGCTTSQVISVTNNSKIWNGTDSYWDDDENWIPLGKPTASSCIIIPDLANDPVISNTQNALCHSLNINNNAELTINAGQNLTITDKITVQPNAIFTVNNNANLIQINDSAVNSGSIRYKRIAPNIKGSDYVYWSSPVNNQDMGTIYDSSFPYNSGFKYQWNTTLNNTNGASGNISQGRWEAASGIMTMGRGYIIRGSSSFGMPATSIPTTFTGVPFNGAIPYTVQRGSYTGAPYNGANGIQITNLNDNFNLIGNPYPSSINALKFLQTNAYDASTNPTGKILGNVKLWTHGTDPVAGGTNPFYGSFQYNYNANDYLTINYLGSTTPGSADLIRAGQAFFVQMIDGAAGSGTVSFNNSMRYDATFAPYSNSGFFKNTNTVNSEFSIERHRLWLDLVDSNSQSSGILVGYAADATNEYDNLFDAPTAIPSGLKLFSTITNDSNVFEIQGRSLPFDINDEIPIGINVPTQGNYSFAIGALDGLFEDQNIYLKDTMLNITHDLKSNPYTFTTSAGVTLDRFKIVYINNALGNPNYSIDNAIKVLVNNEVAVSSSNLQMESIEVFNVLGQKLQTYNNINGNYFTLLNLHKNNTTLLLRIKLQTGETVIEKIIY